MIIFCNFSERLCVVCACLRFAPSQRRAGQKEREQEAADASEVEASSEMFARFERDACPDRFTGGLGARGRRFEIEPIAISVMVVAPTFSSPNGGLVGWSSTHSVLCRSVGNGCLQMRTSSTQLELAKDAWPTRSLETNKFTTDWDNDLSLISPHCLGRLQRALGVPAPLRHPAKYLSAALSSSSSSLVLLLLRLPAPHRLSFPYEHPPHHEGRRSFHPPRRRSRSRRSQPVPQRSGHLAHLLAPPYQPAQRRPCTRRQRHSQQAWPTLQAQTFVFRCCQYLAFLQL